MNREGTIFVVSGPSGVGKGTVLNEVMKLIDGATVSVSATTRKPRAGEIDGVHYHFVTSEQFEKMIEEDGLYEYVRALGCCYGTPKQAVLDLLNQGQDVILEIETIGAEKVRKRADCISIFVAPPSASDLKARLSFRGTETDEQIEARLKKCEKELPCMYNYDYIVINDEIKSCARQVAGIIEAERHRVEKNKKLIEKIIES